MVAEKPSSTAFPVTDVTRYQSARQKQLRQKDQLSIEEPLEIILNQPAKKNFTLAITMRTPGHDQELAAGFLFSEGIIKNKNDILALTSDAESSYPDNNMTITLSQNMTFEPDRLQRHFFTNSSCGVCGKTSMQALEMLYQPQLIQAVPMIPASLLCQLPARLEQHQTQFGVTGSVHSAALFSPDGELLRLYEDVGRHNAMDKLIGSLLLEDRLPLAKQAILLVSGRASFELVQKALMADIAILAAIGAPTSLAYQLASRHGMTLAGFLKANRFNIYNAPERIN